MQEIFLIGREASRRVRVGETAKVRLGKVTTSNMSTLVFLLVPNFVFLNFGNQHK